jgi:creatinine amidohydrolase
MSCSHEHSAWPGTVCISPRTLYSVVTDIADSVIRSGLSALVLVNAHGGNYVLSNVVQEANAHGTRMALFPAGPDWNNARVAAGLESSMHEDMHAGEIETSILLHTHPELVKDGFESADCVADDRQYLLVEGMTRYTTSGILGRPSLSSAEKGKAVMASLVQSFADLLDVLG